MARDQRKRRAYTPDEVRARLHQRLDESDVDGYQSRSGPGAASSENRR
ncbi:Uncharacterised protein [Mycobacterium tuberculosis]|uniref:Uncharacterized protein n=1 Tax=Mycobacterium tuberculosis TaxID=1773 RepID=A0A916LAG0_MYCTX|nr:Uncharacterised protein [Mycobacterium tuberculosis]COX69381.1 Uncharacterised protein [Mycobacterium tuberculosis]